MARPKIRPVSPDEVKITREGDTAVFTYADETIGGRMRLEIGKKIHKMTDAELLDAHNHTAECMMEARMAFEHVAIEVPPGKPQIELFRHEWSMKGDVLRCCIGCNSDTEDGDWEPTIEIDDKTISWKEFGRMLLTFEGWGMRLTIVPDDELHEQPSIVLADSKEKYFKENPRD